MCSVSTLFGGAGLKYASIRKFLLFIEDGFVADNLVEGEGEK